MTVQYHYGAFPPSELDSSMLIDAAIRASAAISKYDAMLSLMENPSLFLSPMLVREAVLSSKIEGTQATAKEVFGYDAGIRTEDSQKENDIFEVLNYRNSLRLAEKLVQESNFISGRQIKAAHEELMRGVRGNYKSPGQFRHEQNWIGVKGTSIGEARYVPISPDRLEDAFADWEKYVNHESETSLIKTAIAHAEFEALHPFLDGNGRLGRMLIPLMLWHGGVISRPTFYISAYFERHREEYQDKLLMVSSDKAWTEWCLFFLSAVEDQATSNLKKAKEVVDLHNQIKDIVHQIINSKDAIPVVNALFVIPIFTLPQIVSISHVKRQTASRIINALSESGFVNCIENASGRSPARYMFTELVSITEID